MDNDVLYSALPFDLSGARTKNRFRNELLWGIIKLYNLNEVDCIVVFDYFCDIEFYFEDRYEFYQVKTDKNNASYTIDRISNINKQNESILGKVYILKKIIDKIENKKTVKSAIVSNIPLTSKSGKKYSDVGEISFEQLDDLSKSNIKSRLSEELKMELDDIDLGSIYFVHTSMDLKNPDDIFLSRTYKYATKLLNKQPKNLDGLCAVIMQEVERRACYEFPCKNYQELKFNKGMSKQFLNNLIIKYEDISDDTIHELKKIIDDIFKDNFLLSCKVSRALSDIVKRIKVDLNLKEKEKLVLNYLKENIQSLDCTYLEIINIIKEQDIFNLEDSEENKIVLILYVLIKFKEGYYE